MQATELVCNVYGADYLPCRVSPKIKGYDHDAHGLASGLVLDLHKLITRTHRPLDIVTAPSPYASYLRLEY